jgi:hypothetical protein
VSVSRAWLAVCDNAHRDMVRDLAVAACRRGGLIELAQTARATRIRRGGALMPALTDWEHDEVPPVNLLYPPSVRRIPRVSGFSWTS